MRFYFPMMVNKKEWILERSLEAFGCLFLNRDRRLLRQFMQHIQSALQSILRIDGGLQLPLQLLAPRPLLRQSAIRYAPRRKFVGRIPCSHVRRSCGRLFLVQCRLF